MKPVRRLLSRLFPGPKALTPPEGWELVSQEQRKEEAEKLLASGELLLLKGDLEAALLFEKASRLDPQNSRLWLRQGLAFFEYGSEEGQEKALLVAGRHLKIATSLDSSLFEAWTAWGQVLVQLGKFHNEHHFFLEAKEKYQKALSLSPGQGADLLFELHWDLALLFSLLAERSEEAMEVKAAIDAFQTALGYSDAPPSEFWSDWGAACLQMGLLINDERLFHQAIDYLKRAVQSRPLYVEGWTHLASAYSQLYLNTMDERYAASGLEAYEKICLMSPGETSAWVGYAQLLTESGHLARDPKKLELAVKKCHEALKKEPAHSEAIASLVIALSWFGFHSSKLDSLIEAEERALKALDQFGDDPVLWHAYGLNLIAFGLYFQEPEYFEFAIEKLQMGISMDRSNAELWHAQALAHYHSARFLEEKAIIERSIRFFNRALDLKPACPSLLYDTANALTLYSELFHDREALDRSLGYFESLLQSQKEALLSHPEWLFQYAWSLEWQGEMSWEENHYLRAIDIYLHVLLIDPDYPHIHVRIALCFVRLGEITYEADFYSRAVHYFRFASRQEEENETIWLEWGLSLIHLGNRSIESEKTLAYYQEAETKLLKAGQLGHQNAHFSLACLYSLLGRLAESLDLLRQAEKKGTLPPLEEILEESWLENVRSTEAFQEILLSLEANHNNDEP